MSSNSALMQSYNLMKMSSEVTKTHPSPQFMGPERVNNYYSQSQAPTQVQQPQPMQPADFNSQMYGGQRTNLNTNQLNNQNSDTNFLGKDL